VFVAALVVTAALGGVTIYSWIDALNPGSALLMQAEQTHTEDPVALASVIAAENRTTGLLVGTAVAGAVTLVCLYLTASGGSSSSSTQSARNRPARAFNVAPIFGRDGYQGVALQGTF
jgi:hypothetical protein